LVAKQAEPRSKYRGHNPTKSQNFHLGRKFRTCWACKITALNNGATHGKIARPRRDQEAKAVQPKQEQPVSLLCAQAQQAFYRSLPELLKTHDRKWVAFRGEELIGFARTQTELYERCLRRGLKEDEFVILFADDTALGDQEEIDLPVNP
jgi:hypothetical protein